MKRFSTAPVSHAYFELTKNDKAIREMMTSSTSNDKIDDDIEKWECIAFEITEDGIKFSKGMQEWREENGKRLQKFLDEYAKNTPDKLI